MYQTINVYEFEKAFVDMGRKDQFTYEGLRALFEYLESYEDDTGEQVELDVIALCCDFTEYGSADEAASNYFTYEGMKYDENGNETLEPEEVEESALDFLRDHTSVIKFNGGVIVQIF